jgi:hypothetical protein
MKKSGKETRQKAYSMPANRKHLLLIFFVVCYWTSAGVFAQEIDTAMLCRGSYYTEAEGKAALASFASTYQDVMQLSYLRMGMAIIQDSAKICKNAVRPLPGWGPLC